METEILLNVKVEALDEGGFLATSPDLPGLVVQGRTRAETMELAQANARILMEVYLSEKLPLPPMLRRVLKRKAKSFNLSLPVSLPVPACAGCRRSNTGTWSRACDATVLNISGSAKAATNSGSTDAPARSPWLPAIPATCLAEPCAPSSRRLV